MKPQGFIIVRRDKNLHTVIEHVLAESNTVPIGYFVSPAGSRNPNVSLTDIDHAPGDTGSLQFGLTPPKTWSGGRIKLAVYTSKASKPHRQARTVILLDVQRPESD